MPNTIIDLKRLKKEMAENPPIFDKPSPPKRERKYIRKTKESLIGPIQKIEDLPAETIKEVTASEDNQKEEMPTNIEIFPEKTQNEFLISLSEKAEKKQSASLGKELSEEESSGLRILTSWSAPEYAEQQNAYEKIILAGIIAAGFLAGSLIIKNYLLAAIIFLSYAILYIYAVKKPRLINFAVTTRGIKVNNRLYEFDELRSFWIFYSPPHQKELSLESKKIIMPFIKIPIADTNPAELRRQLIKYLPEVKQEESLTDILARRLGY